MSKSIEATTNYQNDIMSLGNEALMRGLSSNGNRNDVNAIWNMSTVIADNLIINDGAMSKIDEIYFGNERWTEDDLHFNVADLMSALQELKLKVELLEKESMENNFVELEPHSPIDHISTPPMNGKFDMKNAYILKSGLRSKRTTQSGNHMKFDSLNVKNIKVDYINGVPVDDIIFTQNGVLNSVNSLIVNGILNKLNDVENTSERFETVGDGMKDKNLLETSIPADNIHVPGDLIIDSINGVLWDDFVQQIVMRNLPNLIQELTVNGDIIAKENIEVGFLNQISFPGDFLWMHDSDTTIITGQKVFNGIVAADSVDTSGTVDGIHTQETISLGEVQHIRGLTTFTQLEITESLDVNGTINGKHLDDFKPNLSLLESNVIISDCLFQNLQVQGPIFISKDCNGFILDDILSDVVYTSNPKSQIASFKTFESIDSTVELTSNLINNIPVDNYMTTDTVQDITFDQFVGNVMIKELHLGGLFDFINVTELDRNSIKLTGEQFTEAELIFDRSDEINIKVQAIEIQGSFNGLSPSDLIRVDSLESLEINGNVVVNSALINDLVISGEVNGNNVVNGISLGEFDLFRFSRTLAQDITSMYAIENVAIDDEIDSTYVNGLDIADLRAHINHITNLPDFLSSADVKVNNLVIDGNLLVRTINTHDLNSIIDNAVWLNQPNIVTGELTFLDGFEIGQGIIANNVNGENFEDFVSGLVLKTDENVEFAGRKIFQNELHVEQDILAYALNGISIKNIFTKSSSAPIFGEVHVIGDLFVGNVNLQAYVNSIYWSEIENKYRFDAQRSAHVLTNNVRFTSPTNINDLRIQHGLNSIENITDFLSMIIRKNYAGMISGKKQFAGNVIFMDNLQAANLDSIDIPSSFDNMVINDVNQKIIIFGDIAFEGDVAASHVHVSGNILTGSVMDCSLAEWNENALRTNSPVKIFQHLIFPAGSFQTANVELQFLNGNSMATIFTLNSDQIFGQLFLSDLISSSNINVGGLVNGLNMKAFVDNAVLVTGDNFITAPTTLQSARVLSVFLAVDTVNGKNLSNIATLYEDLYLSGPLSFRSINARSLNTKDTISGINFDYWYANALWKAQRENQIVSGIWTVPEAIFFSSVNGVATLNGIPIENLAGQINAHQSDVQRNLEIFNQGYVENCHKMQTLIQKTQTIPYFLTHFDESFSLRMSNVLNSVHFFAANGQNYVVINLGCLTILYAWNRIVENYEKIIETETGNVDSWLDMLDETNSIHLISNTEEDRSNCPTSGLNIWKVDGSTFVHLSKIADTNKFSLLYNSKLHPQRFLAMTKDDDVVNAFDLQNNLIEQWHLPMDDRKFRFVPENANLGIALSNGKQLSSLSYAKSIISTDKRKERSTDTELKRFVRCPFLDEKLENATVNCKLWHKAQMKALSNIGPFKDFDVSTQHRLLKDVNMSDWVQPGSSPFKLKVIPSEKGPFRNADVSPANIAPKKSPFKLKVIPSEKDPFRNVNPMSLPAQNVQSPILTLNSDIKPSTAGNDHQPVNATARDAFVDIEKAVTDMADNIIDSWIAFEAENEDVDFDDSLIGSSSKSNGSRTDSMRMLDSPGTYTTHTNNSQPSTSRDMFGDIEAKTIKLADKVMDVVENIKDSAKESQAKFHDMFQVQPPDNGPYRKMDANSDDQKIENKNLPKIPYTSDDTVLHTTQSSLMYESDGSDSVIDAVTDDTTTIPTTEPTSSNEEHITTHLPYEDVGEEEPKIAKEFFSEGIATAENQNFPNHPAEEIVGITIGKSKKHLVAVSSLMEHTIQGKHDLIRIYEDIIEGTLFQTLVCHRPRSLSVLNIRDETVLAFIENDADIQIFVYRGIQGFVKFTSFELPSFITKLTSIHLPVGNPYACTKSYLAATMKKEIRFIEAKTCGYCGIDAQLTCD